jgi:hypothetical protein
VRRAGLRIEDRVRDERSVVFPQYGLIGSAVLFTDESNEARLAQATAMVKGVDFAAYEKGGIVHLLAQSGAATIERRGDRFRYRAERGDPLGMDAITRQLKAGGKMDEDGFIAGADWFEATRDDARPDAVRRIYEGLTGHVEHRASLILNLEDGYYTGSFSLDIFAFLQATHGNLGREQSTGFILSTTPDLPAHLRAQDVWQAIGSPRLHKQEAVRASAATD